MVPGLQSKLRQPSVVDHYISEHHSLSGLVGKQGKPALSVQFNPLGLSQTVISDASPNGWEVRHDRTKSGLFGSKSIPLSAVREDCAGSNGQCICNVY